MNSVLRLHEVDLYVIKNFGKAKKAELPTLSLTTPSLFYFILPCSGHYVGAEVCVTPTPPIIGNPQNPTFEPALRFTNCEHLSLDLVIAECQKAYDACIRPNQWTFSDYASYISEASSLSCKETVELACQRLYETCGFWAVRGKFQLERLGGEARDSDPFYQIEIQDDRQPDDIAQDKKAAITIASSLMCRVSDNTQDCKDVVSEAATKEDIEMMANFLQTESGNSWLAWVLYGNFRIILRHIGKSKGRRPGLRLGATDLKRQTYAKNTVYALNSTINNLCEPPTNTYAGCSCGLWGYTWFRRANARLAPCIEKNQYHAFIFGKYMAALLREIKFPNPPKMVHIPAIMSLLCNVPYKDVCTYLGLGNLADLKPYNNPQLAELTQFISVCPTHGHQMESPPWQKNLYSPELPSHIQLNILAASRLRYVDRRIRRLNVTGIEAYEIEWPSELDDLAKQIANAVKGYISAQFKEELRWGRTLVVLRKGGLRAGHKACAGVIVPLVVSDSYRNPRVQFDTGDKGQVLRSTDWWTPMIIEQDVALRADDCVITFVMLRYYASKHFAWLDGGKNEDEQKWFKLTSEFWKGLFEK